MGNPPITEPFGKVIWITGFSGSGKSTVARLLVDLLRKNGVKPIFLDGDQLREVLKRDDVIDANYNLEARTELALIYARLCEAFSRQGHTVVIATISMYDEVYMWNRLNMPNYVMVYLHVPIEVLIERNQKGLYADFATGDASKIVGLDICSTIPDDAAMIIDNFGSCDPASAANLIFDKISEGI